MKTKKKVVKKRIQLKKSSLKVGNIDIVQFYKTGKTEYLDHGTYIEDNILMCITSYPKSGDVVPLAIKIDNNIIINGDNIIDRDGDILAVLEELQSPTGKINTVTTSFLCLRNAGINLNKIKVIDTSKDLNRSIKRTDKGFDEFDNKIPQGATFSMYDSFGYKINKNDPGIFIDSLDDSNYEIRKGVEYKKYHRAGSMVIKEGSNYYLCSMDEDSYFVTKLSVRANTIDGAFRSLKPKEVQQWENKNKTQARRQGEWFFIPTDLTRIKGMRKKGLPLWKEDGNKHVASKYIMVDGKHYVSGYISHSQHKYVRFHNNVYEAIMNTATGNWSVTGVD
jgi:hypothetical protein